MGTPLDTFMISGLTYDRIDDHPSRDRRAEPAIT
jgi:hypothetical protein